MTRQRFAIATEPVPSLPSFPHASHLPGQVCQIRFENDWRRACRIGLVKIVMRADDDAKFGVDEDNDGIPDEIEELGDLLWDHQQMLYALALHHAPLSCAMNLASYPKSY